MLTAPGAAPIELKLHAVDLGASAGGGRTPFTLLFVAPDESWQPQATYRLENPTLGALDIFLVPVGAEQGRMRYEAVFN